MCLAKRKGTHEIKLQKEASRKLAFVGDGPMMHRPSGGQNVRTAMGSGTDIAIESADLVTYN